MVTVEVLLMGVRDARLTYRSVHSDLGSGVHPDAVAARLAGPVAVLHSTSWRFAGGGVVLTYAAVGAVVPDGRVLFDHSLAHSGDPTRPGPPHVCDDAVATHAARHLAWLREHDEVVATALAGLPDVWPALDRYAPGPAGQLDPSVALLVDAR